MWHLPTLKLHPVRHAAVPSSLHSVQGGRRREGGGGASILEGAWEGLYPLHTPNHLLVAAVACSQLQSIASWPTCHSHQTGPLCCHAFSAQFYNHDMPWLLPLHLSDTLPLPPVPTAATCLQHLDTRLLSYIWHAFRQTCDGVFYRRGRGAGPHLLAHIFSTHEQRK